MEAAATASSSDGTLWKGVSVTSGYVDVAEGVKLYYEIRRPQSLTQDAKTEKLVMVMGALATSKHFEEAASILVEHFAKSSTPFEVLIFDNRGIGKSTAPLTRQTTRILAEDALSLINKIWGESSQVHIFGPSLGGMISQELAASLAKSKRLRSLYLAVTSRGTYIRPMALLGPTAWLWLLLPMIIKPDREKMVREYLLPTSFADDTPKEELEKFAILWIDHMDEYYGFSNKPACACQMPALGSHYLTDDRLQAIRDANVPISFQISAKDKIIPPDQQRKLAALLKAKPIVFEQGHVTDCRVKEQLVQSIVNNLESAASAK